MSVRTSLSNLPPLGSAFRLFWVARASSNLAFQTVGVAVGWQVYALSGSAFDLGLVGLAQFLPQLCLTLLVGHVADRYDRRRIVSACQAIEGAVACTLFAGSLAGWLDRHAIFALVAVLGAARAFEGPTTAALLPGLIPDGALSRATALSVSATQTATIVGPSLGGVLYAVGGSGTGVYGLATVLFCLASASMACIRTTRAAPSREPATLASVLSGLSFIRSRKAILGAISLDLFSVLLGGATALLPVFARDILDTGPWGLGALRAAPALGALSMSVVLARYPIQSAAGIRMFVAVATFGIATVVFGLSRSVPLSLAALYVLGAADVISVVVRQALVQGRTPDAMRGRVGAVNALFIGTSNQLGEFESGMTAAALGTVPAVVAGGIGTLLVALLWSRLFPELRRVDRLDTDAAVLEAEASAPATL